MKSKRHEIFDESIMEHSCGPWAPDAFSDEETCLYYGLAIDAWVGWTDHDG